MTPAGSFVSSSRPREKRATFAGTHVPRLFDHLLASRVVRRCPHCFGTWPAVFKFARFELGASPNPGVRRRVGARGRWSGPPHYRGRDPSVLSRGGDGEVAGVLHGVTLPAYRGCGARGETKGKGGGKGRGRGKETERGRQRLE